MLTSGCTKPLQEQATQADSPQPWEHQTSKGGLKQGERAPLAVRALQGCLDFAPVSDASRYFSKCTSKELSVTPRSQGPPGPSSVTFPAFPSGTAVQTLCRKISLPPTHGPMKVTLRPGPLHSEQRGGEGTAYALQGHCGSHF